jgi:hypothetical protein
MKQGNLFGAPAAFKAPALKLPESKYIFLEPSSHELIYQAKRFRAKRDRKNLRDTLTGKGDTAWTGDLGEAEIHNFFEGRFIKSIWKPHLFLSYDFIIGNHKVEAKTTARHVPVINGGYAQSLNLLQIDESEADYWLFMSYNLNDRRITIVGGCTTPELEQFQILPSGTKLTHANTVAEQRGGKIRNVVYDGLRPIENCLADLAKE